MGNGLFAGLKVIDCASFIAAPLAATVLSDFGADVIKIEPPGEGDAYRSLATRPGAAPANLNYGWVMGARNKRSIALDLKSAEGVAILYKLVEDADVFITNLPLPVRRRLKVAYEDLGPRNDRLIYASFTAYGETGPEADKTGFDSTAYWARSGLMDLVKPEASSPPARSGCRHGRSPERDGALWRDRHRPLQAAANRTGRARSSSLLANGLWSNGFLVQARLVGAVIPPRPPRHETQTAMTNLYRTRDDRWFNLAMVNDVKQYPVLVEALGRPDLATDPRFDTAEKRRASASLMLSIFDEIFGAMDLADIRKKLDQAGITFGIIATLDEALDDEQMRAAEAIIPSADGTFETINSPFHIGGETKVKPGPAPELGQHSDEILRQAGYSESDISRLRGSRVVT